MGINLLIVLTIISSAALLLGLVTSTLCTLLYYNHKDAVCDELVEGLDCDARHILNSHQLHQRPSDSRVQAFKRVLIVGNSPHSKQVESARIDHETIVIGINRCYLDFWPNYLYFHDPEIIDEMVKNKVEIPTGTRLVTDEYFYYLLGQISKEQADPVRGFLKKNNVRVVTYYNQAYHFTTLQAIVNAAELAGCPTDRTLVYLAGISMQSSMNDYAWDSSIKARPDALDRQFDLFQDSLRAYPFMRSMLRSTNPDAGALNSEIGYVKLGTLYRPPVKVIWFSDQSDMRLKGSVDLSNLHIGDLSEYPITLASTLDEVGNAVSSVAYNVIQIYGKHPAADNWTSIIPRKAHVTIVKSNSWRWNIPVADDVDGIEDGAEDFVNVVASIPDGLVYDISRAARSGRVLTIRCQDTKQALVVMKKLRGMPYRMEVNGEPFKEEGRRIDGEMAKSWYETLQDPERVLKNLFSLYESEILKNK